MKSFKNFAQALNESPQSDEEIKAWLKKHNLKGKIVNGTVELNSAKLDDSGMTEIGVEISKCSGDLYLMGNKLTNLKGCPKSCQEFMASNNELVSLEGGPIKTLKDYVISSNHDLESLEYGPLQVAGFYANYCNLISEKTIQYLPEEIGGICSLKHNQLTNLKGIHKRIKHLNGRLLIGGNPIKSHVLGTLLIPGLTYVSVISNTSEKASPELTKAIDIINKYLKNNKRDKVSLLECQEEMINEDLDDYAEM